MDLTTKQSLCGTIESKQSVSGILEMGGSTLEQTYILRDVDGRELVAVVSDEEVTLDATPNDIREGKVAATDTGVTIGEKVIPAYHTNQGAILIPVGSEFKITSLLDLDAYDYTKLQAVICDFNTSLSNSVSTNKVVIEDHVYAVHSVTSLSVLVKNEINKSVDFGIINDTGIPQILRFFTYKEIE